jgi:hypothetical protein
VNSRITEIDRALAGAEAPVAQGIDTNLCRVRNGAHRLSQNKALSAAEPRSLDGLRDTYTVGLVPGGQRNHAMQILVVPLTDACTHRSARQRRVHG